MMKCIRRGSRRSLVRVHEVDENQKMLKTHIGKDEIEKGMITCSKEHFTKTYKSNAHNNKIHLLLQKDQMRNKILRRRLVEDDCGKKEVY